MRINESIPSDVSIKSFIKHNNITLKLDSYYCCKEECFFRTFLDNLIAIQDTRLAAKCVVKTLYCTHD